jgi:N-acetylglucosamine-6-phosphate deacetylase
MALVSATVYTGTATLTDHIVVLEDGVIDAIVPAFDTTRFDGEIIDLGGSALAPGLIDLQVNGGGDVLFNDEPTVDALAAIVDAHQCCGTTDLLATFITGEHDGMRAAARAVLAARHEGVSGALGIHFEGPVLAESHRGVHNKTLLRSGPRDQLLGDLTAPCPTTPTVVTLAPEVAPPGFVGQLSYRGAVVSAGHTGASADQVSDAVDQGLRLSTHLWNGMPPMRARQPGPVAALLADGRVWCGFIADGHHVEVNTLTVSFRAKQSGRALLVSDAMPPVGGHDLSFSLGGEQISVSGQRCHDREGALAGAAVPLLHGVRHCVQQVGVPIDEALRMASLYPAQCLGVADRRGRIAPGYPARLLVLDDELTARAVIVDRRYRSFAADDSAP